MIKALGLVSPVIVPFILSGILLFSAKKNNRPKLYLAGYMLLITFVFAANYLYFQHNYLVYSYLHSLHIGSVLAIYPGAYIYITLLTEPTTKLKQLRIHFAASFAFILASAIIFFPFLSPEERFYFLAEYRFKPNFEKTDMWLLYIIRMANIIVLFVQVIIYSWLFYKKLKTHRERVISIFSNPEKFQLNWLRIFNVLLAMAAFVSVFLYTVNSEKLFGDDRFLAYPLLTIAFILWFLGIMGNNQAEVYDAEIIFNESNTKLSEKIIPSRPDLESKLYDYFTTKKPYLNPNFKIWDVCLELGTNRSYISKLINKKQHQNFSAFVNSYRIKEACGIIAENPHLSLSTIALESGFGSVSSFSRAFANITNTSIATYRKQCVDALSA